MEKLCFSPVRERKRGVLMRYVGNPVQVDAWRIIAVTEAADGVSLVLTLEDHRCVLASPEMTARYVPKPGDFWVVQEDGYEYVNPAAVFERKYSTAGPSIGWAIRQMREGRRLRRKVWTAGVYVAFQAGYPDGIPINSNTAAATGLPQGTLCRFAPYVMQRTEAGEFIPYVCGQADLLAADWELAA